MGEMNASEEEEAELVLVLARKAAAAAYRHMTEEKREEVGPWRVGGLHTSSSSAVDASMGVMSAMKRLAATSVEGRRVREAVPGGRGRHWSQGLALLGSAAGSSA